MKQNNKIVQIGLLVLAILFVGFGTKQITYAGVVSDGEGVIIYLDAGHDATHAGCNKNGLKEDVLNLKIARYCKAKLEEYEGVTVYLSRKSEKCPYADVEAVDSTIDNTLRVEDAVAKNATLYVALHNNAYKYASCRGAVVIYPNANYNKAIGKEGKAIAKTVLNYLTALGLKDQGVRIRNTEDDTRYPDNSKADYYNIIKTAKLNGIPAIIVEHAFITNRSDANTFLKSESGLKKLGEADAKAIAEYYCLKKKRTGRVNLKKVVQKTEDMVKVTWADFEGADYYVVLRRELLSSQKSTENPQYSDWEIIGKTKKNYFADKDFEHGTTYCYTVKAHMAETDQFSKRHSKGFSVTTK